MVDLLARGAAFLHAKLVANASRSVTYQRGATEVAAVATVGKTPFRLTDANGFSFRVETRDYLIAPADLGALFPPVSGDRILETVDGTTHTYETTGPGGEPEWRWSGPDRQRVRIHTTRMSAQA